MPGWPKTTRSQIPHRTPKTAPGRSGRLPGGGKPRARRAHAPVPPLQGLGAPPSAAIVGSPLAFGPGLLRQPPGRDGRGRPPAAATCGTGLAAREQNGQDRAGPASWARGGTCRAEGDPGHRGDDCSACSLSGGQSCAPSARTPGPLRPPGKTTRLKRRAAGGQRGSYSPVSLSSFGRRVSPSSPMLCERSPGCYRCLPSSLQGAGASRRGATWEL